MQLDRLNPDQRAVVQYEGHCLAIACPGSGKTSTLANKAAYLLQRGNRVAAVTFTRDAAMELLERIIQLMPDPDVSGLLVGTFHSIDLLMAFPNRAKSGLGRSILSHMKTPFKQQWKLVETVRQYEYIRRAIKESGVNVEIREALSVIEKAKALRTVHDLEDAAQDLVAIYQSLLERAGVIDFQDIILKTNEALREGTLSPLPVDFLLVDEFQDTDQSQYEWVSIHGQSGAKLTAVGDDDQSIYAFRRALGYDVMARFVQEFRADRIQLGTNYRCKAEILGAAEKLILNNSHRLAKALVAASGEGGIVTWEVFQSATIEAAAIAEEAYTALAENASFAVIARTHRELLAVQKALIVRNIPFIRAEGESLFDRIEVQVYGALLRTLIKPIPSDIDMVLGWAGLAENDSDKLSLHLKAHMKKGTLQLKECPMPDLTKDGKKLWRNFTDKHARWETLERSGGFQALNMGVHGWLEDVLKKPSSLKVLETAASLFMPEGRTLREHLTHLKALERNVRENNRKGEGDAAVHLLTCHAAKGLEYDRVWIIGLMQDAFPSDKSALDEERRLMYVAMTRAREYLWISATTERAPSQFVYESGLLASPVKKGGINGR